MWTEKFSYDRNSNIINKANGWGSIDYSYNATNSMVKAGNRSFDYDFNGNLLTESLGSVDTTYKYNVSNRVVDVFTSTGKFNGTEADPQNRGVEFTYDVLGRRSSRLEYTGQNTKNYLVESNKTTMYDGFGINPLADFVDNSMIYGDTSYYAGMKPKTEFVRGNGQVLTTGDFGTTTSTPRMRNREYLHHDILGSTMMVTSRAGSLTSRYSYDAFGNAYEGNFVGGNNKLGYNGKEFDPVAGIYNYGFRDYSARLARFTTVDPIRDGSNWYAYCNNDPVNFIDPNGLKPFEIGDLGYVDFEQKVAGWKKGAPQNQAGYIDDYDDIMHLLGFRIDAAKIELGNGIVLRLWKGDYNVDMGVTARKDFIAAGQSDDFLFAMNSKVGLFYGRMEGASIDHQLDIFIPVGSGGEIGLYKNNECMTPEQLSADLGLVSTTLRVVQKDTGNVIVQRTEGDPSYWTTGFNYDSADGSLGDVTRENLYTENLFVFESEERAQAFYNSMDREAIKLAMDYRHNNGEMLDFDISGNEVIVTWGKPKEEYCD